MLEFGCDAERKARVQCVETLPVAILWSWLHWPLTQRQILAKCYFTQLIHWLVTLYTLSQVGFQSILIKFLIFFLFFHKTCLRFWHFFNHSLKIDSKCFFSLGSSAAAVVCCVDSHLLYDFVLLALMCLSVIMFSFQLAASHRMVSTLHRNNEQIASLLMCTYEFNKISPSNETVANFASFNVYERKTFTFLGESQSSFSPPVKC